MKPHTSIGRPGMIKDSTAGIRLNSANKAERRAVTVRYATSVGGVNVTKVFMKSKVSRNVKNGGIGLSPGNTNLSTGHCKDTETSNMSRGSRSGGWSGAVNEIGMASVKKVSVVRNKLIVTGSGALASRSVIIPKFFCSAGNVPPRFG